MENISFNFTMFLEFQVCTQSVRILSNLELEKLATIFLLFSICSWSVFKAIRGLVPFFQISQEASNKNNYSLE